MKTGDLVYYELVDGVRLSGVGIILKKDIFSDLYDVYFLSISKFWICHVDNLTKVC